MDRLRRVAFFVFLAILAGSLTHTAYMWWPVACSSHPAFVFIFFSFFFPPCSALTSGTGDHDSFHPDTCFWEVGSAGPAGSPVLGRLWRFWRARPQLNSMPFLDLLAEHLVYQSVLFDDGKACELLRHDIEREHGSAATGDVLDFELGWFEVSDQDVEDAAFGVVEITRRCG